MRRFATWPLAAVIALALGAAAARGAGTKAGAKAEAPPAAAPAAGITPRTLEGYVEQEKFFYDWQKKNHPLFRYEKEGRLVGKYSISDREEEFVEFGGGKDYAAKNNRHASITYRLPSESILDLPNKFVGSEKCGECHPAQYEKWVRSRHRMVVRFPDEMVEVGGKDGLKTPMFPKTSPSAILPPGIEADYIYAVIGTPRTKYGFIDPFLVRGTYHVEDGTLKAGTGKIVAGGNQFSLTWARDITPEVAKSIAAWVPGFPTTMEAMGDSASGQWGTTSYGAQNRKSMLFQPATSYCEVCHSWKFDFKSQEELIAALGKPEELRKHTINKGISCEECHGAGGHLVGARSGSPSNCERCHQRFAWNEEDAKANPTKAFNAYFKTRCPSCGTEGAQGYYSAHREAGMTCSTCHDPHEVTANDWKDPYTVPGLKKQCESCHEGQAAFAKRSDMHGGNKCSSCHMPTMMSCENFAAIQFPDHGGFDAVRTSHIWKIKVDPEAKTLNPPPGEPRDSKKSPWRLAKEKGRSYVDLMWSCGRTSWADDDLVTGVGCHSPVQSQLPKGLHFTNQRMIYDRVVGWQKPVQDGVAEIKSELARLRPTLLSGKGSPTAVADALVMLNQVQGIVDAIEKDGSSGVHAPKYTLEKVREAKVLIAGAKKGLSPAARTR
jgi:hypothetical protein